MRIRTAFLAAAIAVMPVLAVAQTAAPATQPPAATAPDSATPNGATAGKPHRQHGDHHKHRAEMRAKYEQLSAADKAKFDDLGKQLKSIHQQRMQLLGISKS
jgi:Spy/CpxP family protein refolding chaperone